MPARPARPALLLLLASHPTLALADLPAITHRSAIPLPSTTTDQNGAPFTIAGLSGITRLAGGGGSGDQYLAVMDNSSKLVRLSVQIDSSANITQVTVLGGITLSQSHDMEGIAPAPSDPNSIYISEEDSPAVRRFSLTTGAYAGALPLPPVYLSRRTNLGLESLHLAPNNTSLWTANENALTVDGPAATATNGSTVRLLRYDTVSGNFQPAAQYAYNVEPLHGPAISGSKSGLCDLIVLPGDPSPAAPGILALERSLALSATPFLTRIYLIDLAAATEVSALPGLIGQTYTAAAKTLIYSGSHDNLEGLILGPELPPLPTGETRYAMLGIVDDGDPISTNTIHSFELTLPPPPPPPCYPNCDQSSVAPTLNIADFTCFLTRFAAADPYANCDHSTTPPILNVADFSCFLQQFAAGCQ